MSRKEHFDSWVLDYCKAENVFDHSFTFWATQACLEDIDKYRGKYRVGWDSFRVQRFKRMRKLGILPENAKLSPPEENLNKSKGPLIPSYTDYYPWESLSELQKDSLDLDMAVYAAMID